MSGTPNYNPKVETPPPRPMKKSTFVTQMEMQRQQRISAIQPSKRQLSFSSFLDLYPQNSKGNFYKSNIRKEATQKMQETDDELRRARSVKASMLNKPNIEIVQKNIENQLNENVVKLKIEEMTFKYKLKISNLLKQLNIPSHQLASFNNIVRVDDILNFLSQKVRQKIVNTQINEANINKARSKQKGTMGQYQVQIETLNKKLKDKENSQKILKTKVKQLHSQSQQLLDKLSLKQKQLSSKVTELYQIKTELKQSQKTYQNLKQRFDLLEKQTSVYREQLQEGNKDNFSLSKSLKQENTTLQEKLQELEEQLKALHQKQTTLTDINSQLTQELTRWRQRFQDVQFADTQTKKSSDSIAQATEVISPSSHRGLRKSTMSMSINMFQENSSHPRLSITALQLENMKLSCKIEELQKKNKQLSRDILNYGTVKERYENLLGEGVNKSDSRTNIDSQKSISLNQKEKDNNQIQLQNQYKKKIQGVVQQWKQKLYQIVHKYEDDLQIIKQKSDTLAIEKEHLQKKVKQMAVQKYALENKVISHEKQIFQLLKMYKNTSKRFQDSIKQSRSSQYSDQKSRKSSFAQIITQQKVQSQPQVANEQLNTVSNQEEK